MAYVPMVPDVESEPQMPMDRGHTTKNELKELAAKYVMGWQRPPLGWSPVSVPGDAFVMLRKMDHKVSVGTHAFQDEADMGFILSRYSGQWAVSVAHNESGPFREVYHDDMCMALVLACLYRKGVKLPEHPEILWVDEDEGDFE